MVEMVTYEETRPFSRGIGKYAKAEEETRLKSERQDTGRRYVPRKPVTVGWKPDLPTIRRGIVLDPFCGTATSGEVALKLGRHFIGIELYEENAQIAEDRCRHAYDLRSEYEAENPMKASTASFDEALNRMKCDSGSILMRTSHGRKHRVLRQETNRRGVEKYQSRYPRSVTATAS